MDNEIGLACPRCGNTDYVRSAAEVCADSDGDPELADALAPAAPETRPPWLVWVSVLALACAALVVYGIFTSTGSAAADSSTDETVVAVVLYTLPALLIVAVLGFIVAQMTRSDRAARQARPHATAAWESAYHCGHCDGVFFAGPSTPGHLPVEELVQPESFQALIRESALASVRSGSS